MLHLPPPLLAALRGSLRVPDSDFCANATYQHRLDDPATFNFCSVPGGGADAFLFAGLAVLVACCLHFGSLSAVFVLVAGALAEGLVFPFNLGRLGNAFTLWLGIDPPEIFFYAFLPPLLLDSALSIDYFLFHKVMLQVMVFAFLVVALSALLTTPVLLYGLGLAAHGWRWQHGALFSSILASTDALAITAVLRRAGGPESLVTLMEGESLLNDASGIVLFQLFLGLVQQRPEGGGGGGPSPLSVLPLMAVQIAKLAAGGVAVGLAAGMLTRRLLRVLRWYGASASQEVAAIQATSFLAFYVANSPLGVSGVIAVVVFGLYGNSTSCFELASSRHMREAGAVLGTVSFALNGIVFFFAGASAVNFMIRAVENLLDYGLAFALFPPVYLSMLGIRGVCIMLCNPLFHLLGSQALPLRAVAFATWGGLRGAISLIMCQLIVTDESLTERSPLVSAQIGLWVSLFVLSTLLINAPTIPAVLRFTGLAQVSPVKLSIREKAKRALLRYTAGAIQDLKSDEDEMLRGVDWGAVARYVDLSEELHQFDRGQGSGPAGSAAAAATSEPPTPSSSQAPDSPAAAAAAAGAGQPRGEAAEALGRDDELFGAAGWAAPSSGGTARSRRAEALAGLGKVSGHSPRNSSRRLLGASPAALSHKWEPRSGVAAEAAASSSDDGSDIEALLLPASSCPGPRRGSETSQPGSQGPGSPHRGLPGPAAAWAPGGDGSSGMSRSGSVDRLTKYGSSEFADESPFFPASGGGSSDSKAPHLASAKSAPQMHTIVEVASSEEDANIKESWAEMAADRGQPVLPAPGSSDTAQPQELLPSRQPQGQPEPQHFAPLDFDILPSFPSDAASSLPDSSSQPQLGHNMRSGGGGDVGSSSSQGSLAGNAAAANAGPVGTEAAALGPAASKRKKAGEPGGSGLPPASPPLPPLRLARVSAPPASSSPAVSSPRAASGRGGAVRSLASDASALPQSPRSMQGLVRTSLLPSAADRTAVQHVGELLNGDEEAGAKPPAASSYNASPFAAPQAAGVTPSFIVGQQAQREKPSRPPAFSRGPSQLRQSATAAPQGGWAGGWAPRNGGGLIPGGPSPSVGLASALKPPSPPKISSLVTSAGSPKPSEDLQQEQEQPAVQQQQQQRQQADLEQPPLDLLDAPATHPPPPLHLPGEAAGECGSFEAGGYETAGGGSEEEIDTGLELDGGFSPTMPQEPPGAAGSVWAAPPAQQLPLPPRAASVTGVTLDRSLSQGLAWPGFHSPGSPGAAVNRLHASSMTAPKPAAGAGVAVAARFAAAPGIKPWQAGALLLRRSMSTPLTGIADQLERQQQLKEHGSLGGEDGGPARDGGPSASEPVGPGGDGQWSQEVLAEARMRLVAGLKRYFHAKRGEGLLSPTGLRILDHACDRAIDCSGEPLDIWSVAEGEAVGKHLVRALAWLFFRTKRATGRLPHALRWLLMPPLRWFSGMIGGVLSVTMLVACEVAVEYWMALTWSPQAQWLRESEKAGRLQAEIAEESARVSRFIIDREIEAPERFQAIQSYRAAMAILRQQAAFVDELHSSGIVNDAERQAMQEPIQRRARQLEIQGPVWRAPSVREVLRGLPFFHHVPQSLFDWLLEHGQLLEYSRGEVILAPGDKQGGGGGPGRRGTGLWIVVYGLVRASFSDRRGVSHEYCLGSGGVLGLLRALTGRDMPGSGPALAEANALHKGPVVFFLPQPVVRRVRQRAAAGDRSFAQLELDLFRVAGLYVVERMRGEVVAGMAAQYKRLALERARRRAFRKAAAAAAAAATAHNLPPGAAVPRRREERAAGQGGFGAAVEPPSLRQRVRWDSSLGDEQAEPLPSGTTSGPAPHAAPPPPPPPALPLSEAEVLAGMDQQRLWHSAQSFARGVLAELRHRLRDAELLRLAPRQPWRRRGHALLLHGSLHGGSSGEGQQAELHAPAVMPWLLDSLQQLGLHGIGAPAAGARMAAGAAGALLLLCPERRSPPSTPSSAAGSAAGFGSPFAATRPWQDEEQPPARLGEGDGDGEGEVESRPGEERRGGGHPLEPAARPLHRVKSRRLPLSTALLGMESVAGH